MVEFGLGFLAGFFAQRLLIAARRMLWKPKLEVKLEKPVGVYVVKLDGQVVYRGEDIFAAKERFKAPLSGVHMELFTNGNHTASRWL